MTDFNAGDEIRAVKGKAVIEGVLVESNDSLDVEDTGWPLSSLLVQKFTVTVTKAALVIPTEPGYYVDKDGDVTTLEKGDTLDGHYAPYIRLEPVAETADKIANWLENEHRQYGVAVTIRKRYTK